jgi:glycosyltransferase involved in cell wall biosynthesis
MLTHSFFERDNRVLRYAETLAECGHSVDVLSLRSSPESPRHEVVNGVRIFRIQDRFGKKEKSKLSFLWPLLRFLFGSSWWLTRRHIRHRYDLIHVHNIPDFLVFAAWYPKLTGARVILDIHDIVPEFFGNKFGVGDRAMLVRGLKRVEALSARFANHVILSNHLWLDTFTARSAAREKCSVIINHVDARIFRPDLRRDKGGKQVVIFPGGLQWHQGLDIAIRAFDRLRRRLPEVEFHIYGDGNKKAELVALAGELGLNDCIRFFSPLPIQQIATLMANADLGVVPKRADSFGNEAYSTKIMEFMSVGVPVVVSGTKIDRYYFDESVVRFFESGNVEAMADAMFDVLTNHPYRRDLVARAAGYVARNGWEQHKQTYLDLVGRLCARRGETLGNPDAGPEPSGLAAPVKESR